MVRFYSSLDRIVFGPHDWAEEASKRDDHAPVCGIQGPHASQLCNVGEYNTVWTLQDEVGISDLLWVVAMQRWEARKYLYFVTVFK